MNLLRSRRIDGPSKRGRRGRGGEEFGVTIEGPPPTVCSRCGHIEAKRRAVHGHMAEKLLSKVLGGGDLTRRDTDGVEEEEEKGGGGGEEEEGGH